MYAFNGKKVLITGATGGIGKAITKLFDSMGADLILSGTNMSKLDNLAKQLEWPDLLWPFDIANDLSTFQTKILNSDIDILVNNAGITQDGLSIRLTHSQWENVMDVNLKSCFFLSQSAVKVMLKKKYGKIINISSVVGFSGNKGQSNYCASKAGMVGMTKSMALEFAKKGININCIAPGFIKSNMTDALTEDQKKEIENNIPTGSVADPIEIANATAFLASDMSNYITGQTLHVNGGLYM